MASNQISKVKETGNQGRKISRLKQAQWQNANNESGKRLEFSTGEDLVNRYKKQNMKETQKPQKKTVPNKNTRLRIEMALRKQTRDKNQDRKTTVEPSAQEKRKRKW